MTQDRYPNDSFRALRGCLTEETKRVAAPNIDPLTLNEIWTRDIE